MLLSIMYGRTHGVKAAHELAGLSSIIAVLIVTSIEFVLLCIFDPLLGVVV